MNASGDRLCPRQGAGRRAVHGFILSKKKNSRCILITQTGANERPVDFNDHSQP